VAPHLLQTWEMPARTEIALVALVVAAAGCSYQLFSPPSRMVTLESARTLEPGRTAAGVKAAGHFAPFDPGVAVGTGVVRRGVSEHLELSGEVSYARLFGYSDDEHLELDPSIYAGRAGMKLAANRHLALTAGLGGGYAPAAGGFGAVDVGGIAAYDNCYAVPFGSLSIFFSQPLGAHSMTFGSHGTSRPSTSYGLSVGTGIEVPIFHEPCRQGRATPKVQLGVNLSYLRSTEAYWTVVDGSSTRVNGDDYLAVGVATGVEISF
jgi:hypothetical protein